MSDKANLTPVMQQYVDMKGENPDALLMFRLGDFYEAFFEDAKTVSNALQLVLTSRGTDGDGKDIPMCGIPWHAADNYFGRLVRNGFKVALVEQMETPAEAKQRGHKYIERKVVRVLTPGTLTDENLLVPKNSNFLVSVVPLSGGVFDVAGVDISTGEFFIGKTHDPMDDMVQINPAEIIYPESVAEDKIILALRAGFKTTPVYEKLYHRADIDKIVSRIFTAGTGAKNGGVQESVADNAVAILAGYLFNTQRDATVSFRAPYEYKSGRQLLIDSATWKSLEIDAPMTDGGVALVDVIDRTHTAAGARRLRAYLRTLSADIDIIRLREVHIGHLLLNSDVLSAVSGMLSGMPDVGRAIARLMSGRGTPRDLRAVSEFLQKLPNAKIIGAKLDDTMAKRFANVSCHDDFALELSGALAEELPTFFRDGNVIRDGFSIALDNMRKLAHGAKETIAGLQNEYVKATDIHNLKIKYNNILGYFIEVPSARADAMMAPDSGFIHRQTMVGSIRFTTERLIALDNDVRSAAEKATGIEADIISTLIDKVRAISDDLLETAELLADTDVWATLALVARDYSWVRPTMTDDTAFEIVGGRHPVIEYALRLRGDNFVKNDCNLNAKSVALLTGPNMAGKSTYLRQNALIVVLAHLGSFVPATSARIGVCDQLFSRVGASDNLAAGQSTFMVEMSETANILNRATKNSFIIFDEIGRGTATYDGMAIAQAVLEYLDTLGPRTLFATHYHELTSLVGDVPDKLNNVSCLTIDVREHGNEIIFMHKIIAGVANRSYGIHVARMAGMPEEIVKRAEFVLENLESHNDTAQKPIQRENVSVTVNTPHTSKVSDNITAVEQLNLFG